MANYRPLAKDNINEIYSKQLRIFMAILFLSSLIFRLGITLWPQYRSDCVFAHNQLLIFNARLGITLLVALTLLIFEIVLNNWNVYKAWDTMGFAQFRIRVWSLITLTAVVIEICHPYIVTLLRANCH